MGGCTSNIVTQLTKIYGQKTILNYAKALIGNDLITSKFLNLKQLITQKFNQSPIIKNHTNFDEILTKYDDVIGKVIGNQIQQKNQLNKMKQYISELDGEGNMGNLKNFRDIIQKKFGTQVAEWKSALTQKLEGKLNIDNYLKGVNL